MFVSVNELIGLPGLPTTAQGIRYTLSKLAIADDMKRMMRRKIFKTGT